MKKTVTLDHHFSPIFGGENEIQFGHPTDQFQTNEIRWIKVGTWRIWAVETIWVFPKMVGFPPKSSILIGFSIIFTIHFGVPQFLETPISSIQKNIKWKTSAPKANFYNMFFFQDHNYLLLNEAANYSLSNSPHVARKWHCSGNCTLWSPLTTPVHPILGAKKRGRSVLWVCT